jgi:hypothetical protein
MLLPKPPPPLKVDKKAHKPAKIFTDIYTLQNRSTLDDECRSDPLIWSLEIYILPYNGPYNCQRASLHFSIE